MNQAFMVELNMSTGAGYKIDGNPISVPAGRIVVEMVEYYAVKYSGVKISDGSTFRGGSVFSFTVKRPPGHSRLDEMMVCRTIALTLDLMNVVIEGMAEISKQDHDDWIAKHPAKGKTNGK